MTNDTKPTLVISSTGKTGSRVAERLEARGLPVRPGSRSANPPFDWEDPDTWAAALDGAGAAYVSYYPDIAIPGAVEAVAALAETALENGVKRLVLLSGRGEEEAQRAERAVRESGADWTIVRCSWFNQNFSEGFFAEGVAQLTVSERRVAELAAEGRSNPEIAQALFVTRKTVETHLGHVYRKLDIAGRGELPHAMAAS